ncbi:MAG: helix-turn-helix transcriptional regulator [Cyanobacteria bacterium SIG27]|nr:helix-turn-helix transcriptional regulator [Cyanobacteria bacterium SIG27]
MKEKYLASKQKLQNILAKYVREKRLEQNKSLSKISAEIMMTKSMWLDLEKGIKDPQLTTLWRVSEALDIPLETLIKEIKHRLGENFSLIDY